MARYIFLLCLAVVICCVTLIYYTKQIPFTTKEYLREDTNHSVLHLPDSFVKVELTVRLTSKKTIVQRFLCDLLRSVVVFWNPDYGDIVLILDKEDAGKKFLPHFNSSKIPHRFRFVYEDPPKRVKEFAAIAKKHNKSFGYYQMLYSSFLMDMYTNDRSVIAWTDTDVILTMPVVWDSIVRNNKLIVKGVNTFDRFSWVPDWDHSTVIAIGFNMVADFMSYFPAYIYPSTMRNCRNHIMKRLSAKDFEGAFVRFAFRKVSPVNIILTYAYYFERHLYDWHIDVGDSKHYKYNEERLPNHPLLKEDTSPELHVAIHSRYFKSAVHPLERALCYARIHLQKQTIKSCERFELQVNLQLFEFQTHRAINHLDTWCGGEQYDACIKMIQERYKIISQLYRRGELKLNTDLIAIVEQLMMETHHNKCPIVKY